MDTEVGSLCEEGSGTEESEDHRSLFWTSDHRESIGAKVGRSDKGWETSVTAIDLTRKGQKIFGKTSLVSIPFTPSYLWYRGLLTSGV